MGFKRYLLRRTSYTLALLLVIVIFNFFLFQIIPFITTCPSGYTYSQCFTQFYLPEQPPRGSNPNASLFWNHIRAQIANDYGLSQPVYVRFGLYFYNMLTFNFGYNINSAGGGANGPVLTTITRVAPFTLLLLGTSTIAAFVIGIGLGVIAAAKRGKVLDVGFLASLLFINSLPVFFLAAVLQVSQLATTGIFYQPYGASTFLKSGLDYYAALFSALFLPFITLTLAGIGGVFLTQRAVMIDAVQEDYILMARAKGLPERTVLFKHAFRNAVLPIFTAFAISIGFILSGAVITETVFGWPGLGLTLFNAVNARDFPLEQAMFLIISIMVLVATFAADLLYGLLDPRVSTS
jgi:peptide/nickel transport system permease protein